MDPRTSEGMQHLVEALRSLGLETTASHTVDLAPGATRPPATDVPDAGRETEASARPAAFVDLWVRAPGGAVVGLEVKRVSSAAPAALASWAKAVRHHERRISADASESSVVGVVVADRVSQTARDWLGFEGLAWLDLRGHLRLTGGGLFIDTDVPAVFERPGRTEPLAGVAGLEVACRLLMQPREGVRVRAVAAGVGRAPSTVSEILAGLRSAGLVDDNRLAEPVELFEQVADRWRPVRTAVTSLPDTADAVMVRALRVNPFQIEGETGWAVTDTVAAAAYGAPVAVRGDHPPDFFVPDAAALRRATQLLGPTATVGSATVGKVVAGAAVAATVAVAPVPAACTSRVDPLTVTGRSGWPLTHPLFVALDLAQDPGRGREILDGWSPPEPWIRVW
jgi:hypothetical protein